LGENCSDIKVGNGGEQKERIFKMGGRGGRKLFEGDFSRHKQLKLLGKYRGAQ